MQLRTLFAVSLALAAMSGGDCFGRLLMGMDGVAWENSLDQGPLLFREVPETDLVSVRAKISAQTAGNWSQAGVIVRAPNAIDGAAGQENWQTSWSFRPAGPANAYTHQSNDVTLGVEAELNTGGQTADSLQYIRLDRVGSGQFQAYRGSGPNDSNITWTPHAGGMQTNANLAGITLQVGAVAGAIGTLPNARVAFDWVEIMTTTQTYRDDFTYTHDFSTGVPGFNAGATSGGAIWKGVENAAAGGTNTISNPRAGECIACVWTTNGSGDFTSGANWGSLIGPGGNDVSVSFGAALMAGPATVYTNKNVTVKKIEFDNATNTYVFGGAGSVTLDADTGSALIDVLSGNHEIQADLFLSDNVTATAAAGTTLNVNAAVFLNGHTFNIGGAGTISLNNGTFASGSPGAGAVVNDGTLAGLAAVQGDYTQNADGTLAVEVGGAPIQVAGAAQLGGVLEVSTPDGFVPTPGAVYTVLTADSVTNTGLSLGGADASLFRLAVAGGSVSLVVGAIPEPTALVLLGCGMLAGAAMCRRRAQRLVTGGPPRPKRKTMLRGCAWVACLFAVGAVGVSPVHAQFGTFHDDFDGAVWDYTSGTVPAGGIWSGIHNPTFGGDGSTPGCGATAACFVSNGTDFGGVPHPGKLFIEDLNLHLNEDAATLGVGWEGNKTNAPLLYRSIPADSKFTATIKIDSQTAGQWSYSAIVARLAGPTVGHGIGGAVDPTESFVTAGSFRTDNANPNNATLLTGNIINAAEQGDIISDAAPTGATAPVPLWIRLEKIGAQFTTSSSADGTTWLPATSVINPELNTPGEMLQVGPSFMMFTGGFGNSDIDFFDINVQPNPVLTTAVWTGNAGSQGSGDWDNPSNWTADLPGTDINANTVNVTLGTTANVAGPTTVYSNTVRKMKSLTFDSVNKYAVSGAGGVTMEADVGTPAINVNSGSHEIQVDVALSANSNLNAAAGTRLDFNNQVDFVAAGRTLTVTGGGKVNFNNNINLAVNGAVNSTGVVGGTGRINGTLNNNAGGTVAPGTSAGTLTVDGNYVQNASAALAIEIGGTAAGAFDKLLVGGLALLNNGTLNVSLINGFVPAPTDTFQILLATTSLATNTRFGNTTAAPNNLLTIAGGSFKVNYVYGANGTVTLSNFAPGGVPGDYNGNGVVDAADYVRWRDTLGTSVTPGSGADGDGNGTIEQNDYTFWKARFGNTSGSASGSRNGTESVPEPNAIALLLIAAIPGMRSVVRRRENRVFA